VEKKQAPQAHELIAEVMRDIGILLMVFAPLDTLLPRAPGILPNWDKVGYFAILGFWFISVGIILVMEEPDT
jgi:hypothetical protein